MLKRLMTYILILTLLFSTAVPGRPVYASSNEEAQALQSLGMLADASDSALDRKLTRLIGLVMILKMIGYRDADAYNAGKSTAFSDMGGDSAWGVGWVNLAVRLGITTGTSDSTFSPEETMSKKEFLAYALRLLGYSEDESWVSAAKLGVGAGLIDSLAGAGDSHFTKRDAVRIVYATLDAKMVDGTPFINRLVDRGVVDEQLARSLNFDGVNTAQMLFADPVTNNRLEIRLLQPVQTVDASQFEIISAAGDEVDVESAELSDGGRMVILRTGDQEEYMTHTVTCEAVSLSYTAAAMDTTRPYLSDVEVLNDHRLRLTFNDEMNETVLDADQYEIEGESVTSVAYEADDEGNSILSQVILTTTTLNNKNLYQLEVKTVYDLSWNRIHTGYDTRSFKGVLGDVVRPIFSSVTVMNETVLRLKFNELMDEETVEDTENYTIPGLLIESAKRLSDGKTVYLETSPQTAGQRYTLSLYGLKDLAGNALDINYLSKDITGGTEDTVRPKLVSAESLSNDQVLVTFSEAVLDETAQMPVAYTLSPELGHPISVTKQDDDGKTWLLTTTAQYEISYVLEVTGVKDYAGNLLHGDHDAFEFTGTAK